MDTRRLVYAIGIIRCASRRMYAVMVLEAHRMAELVEQLDNVTRALVNDEACVENLSVCRLDRSLVPFQRRLEPAQMLRATLEAVSRIHHAKRIDFTIVVIVVERRIERRVFFEHRENRPLHKFGLFPDIPDKRLALAYKEYVKGRDKSARRLVIEIVPGRPQIAILIVAFRVQTRIHACRIEILPAIRLACHKNNREAQISAGMMRFREHCRNPSSPPRPTAIIRISEPVRRL